MERQTEALRLATARLDAGAGTQLEVLDARTQLTTAQSTGYKLYTPITLRLLNSTGLPLRK